MSSTNRSNARQEHISDYYITPVNQIELFLKEFSKDCDIFKKENIKVLDCSAGGDVKHPMSYPRAIQNVFERRIDTLDIRDDSLAKIKSDYLTYDCKNKYDIIITNPPFKYAKEFILKALDDVKEDGYVIFLLRLNFFGSKDRKQIWDNVMPLYTYVHHKRISFRDDGKTDSIEYCHMCFKKGNNNKFSMLKVI